MQVSDKSRNNRTTVILCVICAVLQLVITPNLGIGNGRINFMLILCSCYAFSGSSNAAVFGFACGLFFDLATTGPIGLMALLLTVSSFVLERRGISISTGDLASSVAAFSIAALLVCLGYHVGMLIAGQASSLVDAIVFRTLPTLLVTVLAFVPFAYYFSRVRRSGPSLGGGHFSSRRGL